MSEGSHDDDYRPFTQEVFSERAEKANVEYLVTTHETAARLGLMNPFTVHIWRIRHLEFFKSKTLRSTAMNCELKCFVSRVPESGRFNERSWPE